MLHGSVEHSLEDLESDVGVEEARVTDRAAEVMKLKSFKKGVSEWESGGGERGGGLQPLQDQVRLAPLSQ